MMPYTCLLPRIVPRRKPLIIALPPPYLLRATEDPGRRALGLLWRHRVILDRSEPRRGSALSL